MPAYLRQFRPHCSSLSVFIGDIAPLVGFAICSLVDRALKRAGVESAYRASHLFRASLATQMLKEGASLPEIGDLLRHRRPDTTAIYAKVDLVSLRSIALPWGREVADEATARRHCRLPRFGSQLPLTPSPLHHNTSCSGTWIAPLPH
jgi:integrase